MTAAPTGAEPAGPAPTGAEPAGPDAAQQDAIHRDAIHRDAFQQDRLAVPQADRDHPELTERDLEIIAAGLGRPARGVVAVAARCACGAPLVTMTAPRLEDGTPFPTLYYLTHAGANSAIGRLESSGAMARMSEALAADPSLAAAHRAAHHAYLAVRRQLARVQEIEGVSAGGMPDRVKCLHALAAHALAAGPGVNVLGDQTLAAVAGEWRPDRCACCAASQAELGAELGAEPGAAGAAGRAHG
ncbi:MAG: DUF501 domain-containing protein [Bifidobacteriaceae bacterium]|jgi:hypothetical protein|nr:DUF501 domain-containing protein [Bifidobacteriaceae bacterium]